MTDEQTTAPLKLSREDMYELAWSKPLRDLAKDFGVSDVALAKRCRRLGIPLPGRGYWARVDAGQQPHKPKLPMREAEWGDDHALTISTPHPSASQSLSPDAGEGSTEAVEDIRARIAGLNLSPAASISQTVAAVRRTARELKHSRRSEFVFERGERTGPLVQIEVSDGALDRALLLADVLLRAAESLGWRFVDVPAKPPEPAPRRYGSQQPEAPTPAPKKFGELMIDGERVAFQIEERYREEPRTPTDQELAREKREYGYKAPRKVAVATGNLRVVRLDTYGRWRGPTRQSWYDRGNTKVESHLAEILLGFYELAQSIMARRAEDERREREYAEAERLRKEFEARQEAHAELIKQLERDAGAWHRARYLRRYVHAARRALVPNGAGDGLSAETGTKSAAELRARFLKGTVDFLDWAERYVNQLDPLNPEPRTGEFQRTGSYHYVTEMDRFKDAFARLLGSDWPDAWKLGADYTPDASDRYYGERSVYEIGGKED